MMPANIPESRVVDPAIVDAVDGQHRDPMQLLPILQSLNSAGCGLNRELVADVGRLLHVPPHQVEGVAGFYSMLSRAAPAADVIRVCDGVACWLRGSEGCRSEIERRFAGDAGVSVTRSSCLGLCDRAPAALVGLRPTGPIDPGQVAGMTRADGMTPPLLPPARLGEQRVMLARHGSINPRSLDDALCSGVYAGLTRARAMSPDDVIAEIEHSGLRGRGGGGFPTGRKWRKVAASPGETRYVICNADESEPLMFKDRVLIEGNPHAVIEGVAIAAYAVGAREAIIYVRGEFEPQARLLELAIREAVERGVLDEGGDRGSLNVTVHRGAGAYICGEETALLESLEGRRGEPRIRPPYPVQTGYLGQPTIVNNVESFVVVGHILAVGSRQYLQASAQDEPGTRLFTLLGHVETPGIVEVPFGKTLREFLSLAGDMCSGSQFKLALVGGAAGAIVGPEMLDVPFDYSSAAKGLPMGSGGILFCDETVSAAGLVRELLYFFEQESCGKCTPCRIGTSLARETLDRMLAGAGENSDVDRLHRIARELRTSSFCGLGTGAAEPLESALRNFPQDFEVLIPM